jgi:hypothetical protein
MQQYESSEAKRLPGEGIETCPVLEAAKSLVGDVQGTLPPCDWQPVGYIYNQVLAELRHEYTNYETLLSSLPVCVDLWDSGECPDNPRTWSEEMCLDSEGEECMLAKEAHDMLKWAARDEAEQVYRAWRDGNGV